ncbi:MAG: tRNA (N6-isopentenyl adenosine(37)-C2)-methylthiotransferase MiaB, partial [Alistipes sp.]|nr:tRNA (N6-isopentenyl adenosine(37)-C2)-methylthiotransferase MiaB [Candidatus Minthomonas equi]
YENSASIEDAGIILVNTCSIRENAEQRVFGRLDRFLQEKKRRPVTVGVLGCMAAHLKEKLLEHPAVDLVAGPDSYRRLPQMLGMIDSAHSSQVDVLLSKEETYADIIPEKSICDGITAFISIMRGCDNMCTYCIVPYVRGRERSRDPYTIIEEAKKLYLKGFREVNLLGQNVDSYLWKSSDGNLTFADLLKMTAQIAPDLRVRFSTSHPKDMSDEVISVMASFPNICKHIHLPVQSGSDRMLSKMNRKYDRERYMDRIYKIREILPEATITTDIIAGFCSETEEEHGMTMSLMEEVRFDSAFMFQYSERPGTLASRHFPDDVPPAVKTRRLNEIIELQNEISLERNRRHIGQSFVILVEGTSKRNKAELYGRTSGNKVCIFPAGDFKVGDYVELTVTGCTSATLMCANAHKVNHD